MRMKDSQMSGNDMWGTFVVGNNINPAGYDIQVIPFDGHIKDIRVFSDCIDPVTVFKYGRQRFNMLNTEYHLSFGMRLDESLGLELLETVTAAKIILVSSNGVYPQW